MKRRIYLNEFNIPMDNAVYLPLVSGILQAYAQTFPEIVEEYEFMPFNFKRDFPEKIAQICEEPFMVCFSVCIWNHQLSLEVARLVKDKYPECIVVFGGPQVEPDNIPDYVDHVIEHEGERKFVELLGVTAPDGEIDEYPSPYTLGLYDKILADNPEYDFQAIVETNRGCPFSCSFCYWGQGFDENKIRFHSMDYIASEADWIGRNKIKYVFMADANFGMYKQDQLVALTYTRMHDIYGYPEKVRVCYGKNREDNVFETAKILSDAGLAKAITLAKQSNSEEVLSNINRSNIKSSVYSNLEKRYADAGMTTYSELILGLPGETMASFKAGVDEAVKHCNKLFVYHCTILPNTEMADPAYIKKHGIKTVRVPLAEIHCKIREPGMVTEYEDIVIETNSMTVEDWIICAVYAWGMQLRHTFNIKEMPISIMKMFNNIAIDITFGISRAQVDRKFGNIYWEPEELAYLYIIFKDGHFGDPVEFAKQHVIYGRKGNDGLIHSSPSHKG